LRWIQTKALLRCCSLPSSSRLSAASSERARASAWTGARRVDHVLRHRVEALGVDRDRERPAERSRIGPAARVDVERALALARALLLEELAAQHLQVHQPDEDHERPQRHRQREQHEPQPRAPLARLARLRVARGRHQRQALLSQGRASAGAAAPGLAPRDAGARRLRLLDLDDHRLLGAWAP
jgi:hypothetical protein